MINYSLQKNISFSKIDLNSNNYSIEYFMKSPDPEGREKKLSKYGLLYPPLFIYERDKYKVVLGRRDVELFQKLEKKVPYGLIIEKIKDNYEFFIFLIQVKSEMNEFNTIERAIALKKLYAVRDTIDQHTLQILKVPKNEKIIHDFLCLADASNNLKSLVLSGFLNENTAFEIFRFEKGEWDRIAFFISNIALGTKKRNALITMMYDISQRDKKRVIDIIEDEEIRKILDLPIDPPQKGEKIFSLFEKWRYPFIYQYRKKFYNKLSEVGLERFFHLNVPKDFEKWEFALTFPFSSLEEFRKRVEILKKTGEKQSFAQLMRLR